MSIMNSISGEVWFGGVIICLVMISGCAGIETEHAPVTTSSLVGSTWRLLEYGNPQSLQPALTNNHSTLIFDQNQVSGSAGCNQFNAQYDLNDTSIQVTGIAQTKRACLEEGIMQQEEITLRLLRNATTYEHTSSTLTITAPDGVLVYTSVSIHSNQN